MAGAWPDAPGRKINHREDGSILLLGRAHDSGTPDIIEGELTEETATTNHTQLVDHGGDNIAGLGAASSAGTWGLGLIFPELRDIDGTWLHVSVTSSAQQLAHSADTTNILDGSWTSQSTVFATIFVDGGGAIPGYRDDIYAWTATGRRAIQAFWSVSGIGAGFWRSMEVYGEISAGETPDRIIFLDDDTGLEYAIPQDYGDRPRGSAIDKGMRIKNNSGTLQANTIDVARGRVEAIAVDSSSWYTFDTGGGFGSTFQVASLGAGASDTFTTRQNIPDSTVAQLYEAYVKVDVTSWT